MKKALTLILAFVLVLSLSITALAATEVLLEGEDVYSGNINNGEGMGGVASDNAADLQPGEKLGFTLPAGLAEGEYKVEVRNTGNRTDYNIYVDGTLATTIKRSEGSGWGFDWMTTDAAAANVSLKAGGILVIEAPDNGEYGWVDWVKLTLVSTANPGTSTPKNPGTGDSSAIWIALAMLSLSMGAFAVLRASKKQRQS